uniref:Retrovirus-related Pol polyprotein from transposon TNT 1-94 n=1 Tax=Cajanus cajan TaxID=3821 RepID=A0A151U3E8_CAJCA|nr:Retrovirus-related Pol polyprotein from transposon TNT 1-94 [Cajanus cajan]
MFYLSASTVPQHPLCLQAEDVSEKKTQLWHSRFGHLNYKGLSTLASKQMVLGIPSLKSPKTICTTCLVGKQHRDSIPMQSSWRASTKLQLIHADICGPISPSSHSNKRYILSFIDDYSRKAWIYFLHEKSEPIIVFKSFKACVEKEAGTYITCLRIDKGGEFTSKEFIDFCINQGISRQLMEAYTHQQNRVAECKNQNIMNAIRVVLHEKQVPKPFWPEAVRWCVHVQNRSPTSVVDQRTPEEIWSGVNPRVDYFRIFGCVAHTHVPDQKRSKLDEKSQKCVFLGVSDESKACKLFDPITKKFIMSRDVVFEEDKSWNWHRHAEESKADVLDWEDKETEEDAKPIQHEITDRYDNNQDELEPLLNSESNANQDPPVDALPIGGRAARTRITSVDD